MRTALLTLAAAVALCGSLQGAHIDPEHHKEGGQCLAWIEQHNQEHDHDDSSKVHDFTHKHEMTPECDEDGNFAPKQCHVFSEEDEWCVEEHVCYHFATGSKWCACFDRIDGTMDQDSIQQGGDDLHCDGVVHHHHHPEPEPAPCHKGWTYFTEHDHAHCYKFINDEKTWVEAESYCQFVGKDYNGHLASIHCEETNHFLQEISLENHDIHMSWAGANNLASSCFWMWSDGLHFDYEDWYKDDSKFRPDSCLRISSGLTREWSPGCCNDTLPFICEMETMLWHDH